MSSPFYEVGRIQTKSALDTCGDKLAPEYAMGAIVESACCLVRVMGTKHAYDVLQGFADAVITGAAEAQKQA